MTSTEPTTDRLISIDKARAYLGGIVKGTLYELIHTGEIQKVNIGRRSFITYSSVQAYIQRLKDGA